MIDIRIEDIKTNRNRILIEQPIPQRNNIEINKRNRRPEHPVDDVDTLSLSDHILAHLVNALSLQETKRQEEDKYASGRIYELTPHDLFQDV